MTYARSSIASIPISTISQTSPWPRHGAGRREPCDTSSNAELRSALFEAEHRYESLRTAYDARGRSLLRERIRLMSLIEKHERTNGLQHVLDQLERTQASLARAESAYHTADQRCRSCGRPGSSVTARHQACVGTDARQCLSMTLTFQRSTPR